MSYTLGLQGTLLGQKSWNSKCKY